MKKRAIKILNNRDSDNELKEVSVKKQKKEKNLANETFNEVDIIEQNDLNTPVPAKKKKKKRHNSESAVEDSYDDNNFVSKRKRTVSESSVTDQVNGFVVSKKKMKRDHDCK